MTILRISIRAVFVAGALAGSFAQAAPKKSAGYGSVPFLDVKGSCNDAQKFASEGQDKNVAYKGCMQDEMNAKDALGKRWPTFKTVDKQNCVEQTRNPSPSYVEVLTCLEMNTGVMEGGKPLTPAAAGAKAAAPKT